MNLISEDYLMHHGVKGMKWGVRHDPQPLGKRISNRAINRIEKHRSQKMAETERYKNTKYGKWVRDVSNRNYDRATAVAKKAGNGLSAKQKKILKGVASGAAIAGAGAIGIAALKSGAGKAAISKGAKYLRMGKTDAKIAKIAVKDAVSNNRFTQSGKQYAAKAMSKISEGAKDTKRSVHKTIDQPLVDAKKKISSAKYDAGRAVDRRLSSAGRKASKIKRNVKQGYNNAQQRKAYKKALKDANGRSNPYADLTGGRLANYRYGKYYNKNYKRNGIIYSNGYYTKLKK